MRDMPLTDAEVGMMPMVQECYKNASRVRFYVVDFATLFLLLRGDAVAWPNTIPSDGIVTMIEPQPDYMRFRVFVYSLSFEPVEPNSKVHAEQVMFKPIDQNFKNPPPE